MIGSCSCNMKSIVQCSLQRQLLPEAPTHNGASGFGGSVKASESRIEGSRFEAIFGLGLI